MEKIYFVMFETHQNCQIRQYMYHCMANNAKEAKEIARYNWSEKDCGHQFHLYAKRSGTQDVEKLRVTNWLGYEFRGHTTIGKYVLRDVKTWRYKGSDGQYHYPLMNA